MIRLRIHLNKVPKNFTAKTNYFQGLLSAIFLSLGFYHLAYGEFHGRITRFLAYGTPLITLPMAFSITIAIVSTIALGHYKSIISRDIFQGTGGLNALKTHIKNSLSFIHYEVIAISSIFLAMLYSGLVELIREPMPFDMIYPFNDKEKFLLSVLNVSIIMLYYYICVYLVVHCYFDTSLTHWHHYLGWTCVVLLIWIIIIIDNIIRHPQFIKRISLN